MKGLPGCELSLDPDLGSFQRAYVRTLGAPANGLRIRLRRVLPETKGSYPNILDAGCGGGVFSMELAKLHTDSRVLGIDIEQDLVDRANLIASRAGIPNVTFEVGDVTQLEYRERFDLVVSVDNLEHIEDDVTAMRALFQTLRPGGSLVVHVPARYRRWPVVARKVNFDVPGHMRPGYEPEELESKLLRAGFDVGGTRYTYGLLENLTNNVSYKISGAKQENKGVYAAAFPFLLALSYPGQFFRPRWGAGILARARRPAN